MPMAKTPSGFVVIDTNIWRSELMLRTPMGAAFLFTLGQSGTRIALPEVIEREIGKHLVAAGTEAVEEIDAALGTIQRLSGSMPSLTLPTPDDFRDFVARRLEELDSMLDRVPFTLAHAIAALDRVDAGTPPNGPKNQQFKDSAIWEAILDLASKAPVFFITSDKAFYEGRNSTGPLAKELQEDLESNGLEVTVFPGLAEAAAHLRSSAPPIDKDELAERVSPQVRAAIEHTVGSGSWQTAALDTHELNVFATEKPTVLTISFSLRYDLVDASAAADRTNGSAAVLGTCSYDRTTETVSDIQLDRVMVSWLEADGTPGDAGNVFLSAGIAHFGGPPPIPLQILAAVD